MTGKTAYTDPANTVQIHAMTKGAGILDIPCLEMDGKCRPAPVLRVGIVDTVAAFTPIPAGAGNPNIEARITARATGLTVA
jgi:hypothetical protein